MVYVPHTCTLTVHVCVFLLTGYKICADSWGHEGFQLAPGSSQRRKDCCGLIHKREVNIHSLNIIRRGVNIYTQTQKHIYFTSCLRKNLHVSLCLCKDWTFIYLYTLFMSQVILSNFPYDLLILKVSWHQLVQFMQVTVHIKHSHCTCISSKFPKPNKW